ncbi:acetyl-CoA carboxylase biotin carboxyl carrier protein [Sporolactobacillus sp. THM7-7]|nr:acetyl-CoA carboxylase biotin carboxyl carrier protein [Sporolactobacillus sp. THM7-7]
MLSIEDIKALMKEMDASSISELKYETENGKITLRKADAPSRKTTVQAAAPARLPQAAPPLPAAQATEPSASPMQKEKADDAAADDSLHQITAPMVGTFYASSSPDAEPYVHKGSTVDEKTVVCIVEAMKLFNEIEAEVKGTIVDILVEDGQLVEYGQPLFLVKED